MGSALRLTLHGPTDALDDDRAGAAWTAVAEEFEAAEAAMSRFREDSELTRLNGAAGGSPPEPVSGRLVRALIGADRAERVTGGRFDPRVIRALDRLGYRGAPLEAPARGLSDGRWLAADVRAGRVALAQPVDLGGIGKGLSLRWAARRLESSLSLGAGALLEAGGDLVVRGQSPEGGPWLVGIEGPAGGDEPIAVVSVPAGAVATSSVQVNRWTTPDGRPAHHLIDPRTGAPGGAGLLAVT
jgi:thiamine biosynthesis lipoprotein